jgi:hypothetical protein
MTATAWPPLIRDLENRARRALEHRDLTWLKNIIPARFHNSPEVLAVMLRAAAESDPALAQSRPYEAAAAAVGSWAAGRDLGNRLTAAYEDPTVREHLSRAAGGLSVGPERAYRELIKLSVDRPRLFFTGPMAEALNALAEYRTFGDEHGVDMPVPVERPIEPARLDGRIKELNTASATRRLSQDEDQELNQLYEQRIARDAEPEPGANDRAAGAQ